MPRAIKRKLPLLEMGRRVRARRTDEWKPEPDSEGTASADDGGDDDGSEDNADSAAASGSESGTTSEVCAGPKVHSSCSREYGSSMLQSHQSDSDQSPPGADLSSNSFGALARMQASHPDLGCRKSSKACASSLESAASKPVEPTPPHRAHDRSRNGKNPAAADKPRRASKHAPLEQSSKRPVSRHREIIADPRRKYRDPRFDPLVAGASRRPLDEAKASNAYAFLDAYRDSEMAELRVQIAKTKDPALMERLKRQLMSMESRNKARQRKLQEEELLRDHRSQEKELVAEGKKPFYLKSSEQKKQLLAKRYRDMTRGQVDKAIERKRKKIASKEKKELGFLRRVKDRH